MRRSVFSSSQEAARRRQLCPTASSGVTVGFRGRMQPLLLCLVLNGVERVPPPETGLTPSLSPPPGRARGPGKAGGPSPPRDNAQHWGDAGVTSALRLRGGRGGARSAPAGRTGRPLGRGTGMRSGGTFAGRKRRVAVRGDLGGQDPGAPVAGAACRPGREGEQFRLKWRRGASSVTGPRPTHFRGRSAHLQSREPSPKHPRRRRPASWRSPPPPPRPGGATAQGGHLRPGAPGLLVDTITQKSGTDRCRAVPPPPRPASEGAPTAAFPSRTGWGTVGTPRGHSQPRLLGDFGTAHWGAQGQSGESSCVFPGSGAPCLGISSFSLT